MRGDAGTYRRHHFFDGKIACVGMLGHESMWWGSLVGGEREGYAKTCQRHHSLAEILPPAVCMDMHLLWVGGLM